MDDLHELKQDVKEIRNAQVDTAFQLAKYNGQLERYNDELAIHIAGVKDLQARVKPIEDHVNFLRRLSILCAKLFAFICGSVAFLGAIRQLFF